MVLRRVLLIGWDAADWKVIRPLMDSGNMPNLRRLVERGAAGQIATLHPPLSPMLWTSIATGKRAFQHGIHGFSEPTPDGRGVRPVTNLSRKSKALWNILHQNALRSVVIGWWPSHPAEPIDGVMISDHFHRAAGPLEKGWPLPANSVHPSGLAATIAELRVHPDRLTPEMVDPFIPRAREIDQESDKRLSVLLRTLAECMSIQAAAMWLLDHERWDFFAVYFDAIDHFCHGFMRYHPPRQSWIGEREFELYRNVVSTAYQLHDRMLGELIEKAGQDATVMVMSDHGFHPDHLRPSSIPDIPAGPAVEHRDFGVFAIAGPGIRTNAHVHGASLLDVAPTILALYGLPAGADMDGKVLSQVFVDTPAIGFIPSWEEVPGADGRHPPHTCLDPVAAQEALAQMVALGYIEPPDEDDRITVEKTVRELRYNLAEAYQDAGRHAEAYEILSDLYRADPDEQRFAVRLFISCQALGMRAETQRIVDDLDGRRRALFEEATARIEELGENPDEAGRRELARWRNLARYHPAVTDYLKAEVLIAGKRNAEALAILERMAETQLLQTANLYQRLGRWREAAQVYEQALANDPDDVPARIGLCRLALRARKFGGAARLALDAVERSYHDPLAHFLLGRALAGMKEYERAAEAFQAAISINPHFPEAHVRLAVLLEKHLNDTTAAREHRRLAQTMRMPRRAPLDPIDRVAASAQPETVASTHGEMPPVSESLIIVTGLPRSGTSMIMQMLAAAGVAVLTDGSREADEDNPRGYLEFEPVKNLFRESKWLREARGKAVKIVAPLLAALPPGLACRVILCERDLDEVLNSQERMLRRRGHGPATRPERRRALKEEYARTLGRVKTMLARRPSTRLLKMEHRAVISAPLAAAEQINTFLGGGLDIAKMAAAIDPALHRARVAISG